MPLDRERDIRIRNEDGSLPEPDPGAMSPEPAAPLAADAMARLMDFCQSNSLTLDDALRMLQFGVLTPQQLLGDDVAPMPVSAQFARQPFAPSWFSSAPHITPYSFASTSALVSPVVCQRFSQPMLLSTGMF